MVHLKFSLLHEHAAPQLLQLHFLWEVTFPLASLEAMRKGICCACCERSTDPEYPWMTLAVNSLSRTPNLHWRRYIFCFLPLTPLTKHGSRLLSSFVRHLYSHMVPETKFITGCALLLCIFIDHHSSYLFEIFSCNCTYFRMWTGR